MRTAALESRQHESDNLAELTSLMQAAEDVDDAARILPLMPGRLLAPCSGAVYLVRSSLNTLESMGHFGPLAADAPTMSLGDCLELRRGHAYAASHPAHDIFCGHVAPEAAPAGYVCVRMQDRSAPIRLLHVKLANGMDEAARARAQAHVQRVARQVAVGLANLKLRETLREQSIRDTLIGLFNRRYLEEAMDQELARAKREQRPLASLMMDVDHFKCFNDVHGHEAGDTVLSALGRRLKESARAWGEHLMTRVRAMSVRLGALHLPGVTISMGLACYPPRRQRTAHLATGGRPRALRSQARRPRPALRSWRCCRRSIETAVGCVIPCSE